MAVLLASLSATPAGAQQLVVENPARLPYNQNEALSAYRFARKHVAQDLFPNQRIAIPDFAVTLKLGCKNDPRGDSVETQYSNTGKVQRQSGAATVCLESWNLSHFTYALIRIIETQLLSESKRVAIVNQVVRSVQLSAPVSSEELRDHHPGN